MVRWSTIGRVLAATAVLMAATGSHAFAASTVKLSGSLTGASLPRPAAGVSLVQALNLSDGTLAAAGYSPRGRYSLNVPPGPYALVGGSVFFKGNQPTVKLLGALRARAGKPRRIQLSLRRSRRRPARAAVDAAAASPVVGVPYFTGGAPFQNRGVATMVETDLTQLNGGPPCSFRVVEVQRRDEVIREIRRQQTEFFDPATRVRPGRLLQPELLVKGTLMPQSGGGLSYAISVVNARSGAVKGSTSGTIPESAFTTASEAIARELAKIICNDTALYMGQISGTLRVDSPAGCASDHENFSYNASLASFTGPQDAFALVNSTGGGVENDTGAKGYGESGSGSYTLDPCAEAQSQGCTNDLHQASGSYGQVLFSREGSTVKAEAYTFAWEGFSGCSGDRLELLIGEGTFPASKVGDETITVTLTRHEDRPRIADGSGTLTMQRVN